MALIDYPLRMVAVFQHLSAQHKIVRTVTRLHVFSIAHNVYDRCINDIHRSVGVALVRKKGKIRAILGADIEYVSHPIYLCKQLLHVHSPVAQNEIVRSKDRWIKAGMSELLCMTEFFRVALALLGPPSSGDDWVDAFFSVHRERLKCC